MYQVYSDELYHHGIKGQKWGRRRYQNEDGTYTEAGKKRYLEVKSSGFRDRYLKVNDEYEKRYSDAVKQSLRDPEYVKANNALEAYRAAVNAKQAKWNPEVDNSLMNAAYDAERKSMQKAYKILDEKLKVLGDMAISEFDWGDISGRKTRGDIVSLINDYLTEMEIEEGTYKQKDAPRHYI